MVNKKKQRFPAWGLLIVKGLAFYTLCTLSFIAASTITTGFASAVKDHLSMTLAVVLTALLILLFSRSETVGLKVSGVIPGKSTFPRFFCGYLIGLAMAFGQACIVMGFGHVHLRLVADLTIIRVFGSFALYLLAALREELVFRSYALTSLRMSLGPVAALSIITVIFILEHVAAGMPVGMAIIGSGMGGLLFGYAALKTKGLALPLGLHSAWNFGQWALAFKAGPGIWQAETGHASTVDAQSIGMIAFVLIMAITMAGIHFFYRKQNMGV